MKAFNLKNALAGEKLVTRDGREAHDFHHFTTDATINPCAAMIGGTLYWFRMDGRVDDHGRDTLNDLFVAPKVITKYLNVYDSCTENRSYAGNNSYVFDSEEDAKKNADANSIKVLVRAQPIQWEEV